MGFPIALASWHSTAIVKLSEQIHISRGKEFRVVEWLLMKIPKISEQKGVLEYSNRLSELYATTHDAEMRKIKGQVTKHDTLPDVVLYDSQRKHLFLIEAVTAHGPLSPKRQIELEAVLEYCKVKRIYISAFPDFREFKRHIDNIAWEAEVWVENNPDHVIHFDGTKFFAVYGG
ncbi:MAG: BsuBI/PstI family type II restriction endonuclease [Euryarchaeota archaeon]|nr:BsuBI/PstI family type II restriction endonuclease [Euryarchaeota archaeon]